MKLLLSISLLTLLLVPFFALSLKFLLFDPPIFPDEAYFYTTVSTLKTNGYLATPIYGDAAPGKPHIRSYAYPPLYFYLMNLWTRVRGETIGSIRLFSLGVSLWTLLAFYLVLFKLTRNPFLSSAGMILLMLSAPYGMASRIGRMDILVVCFLVTTVLFWLLWRAKSKEGWLVAAGVCAGLAAITHSWGSVVPILLGILVLGDIDNRKQKRKHLLFWVIPIITSYFFWFLTVMDRVDLLINQFTVGMFYKTHRPMLLIELVKHSGTWAGLLLLYIGITITGLVIAQKTHNRILSIISMCSAVVLVLVTITVEQWYLVYLPVFPLILFILFFSDAIKNKKRNEVLLYSFGLLAAGFFQISIMIPGVRAEVANPPSYETFGKKVADAIPLGSRVLLSALPDPYFALLSRYDLTIRAVPHIADPELFGELMNNTDIMVVTFVTNIQLKEYIEKNAVNVANIDAGGYKTSVVYLKTANERRD